MIHKKTYGRLHAADVPYLIFPLFCVLVPHWASALFAIIGIWAVCSLFRSALRQHAVAPLQYDSARLRWAGLIVVYALYSIIRYGIAGTETTSVLIEVELRVLLVAAAVVVVGQTRGTTICRYMRFALPVAALLLGIEAVYDVLFKTNIWHSQSDLLTRAAGAYSPIIFGDFTVLLLFSCLVFFATTQETTVRRLSVCAIIAATVALLLAQTRGAWLAAIVIGCVLFYTSRFLLSAFFAQRRHLVLLFAAVCIGVVLSPYNRVDFLRDYKQDTSFIERGQQLHTAFYALHKAPPTAMLFGYGTITEPLQEASAALGYTLSFPKRRAHVHNNFITFLLRKGIVGTLLWLAVLLYPVGILWRARHRTPVPSLLGFIHIGGFLLFSLTEVPFIRNNFTAIFFLPLICYVGACCVDTRTLFGKRTHA